ncbi:MAG: hypothetical protein KDB53_03825, partial [Planctomycetes bacterium]|nr:hypothetical protein [Planctomycetota bacterium]
SHANRLLALAALHPGRRVLMGATPCDDVQTMVDGLTTLGFRLEWQDRSRGRIVIDGGLPVHEGNGTLPCGPAGTALRFLVAIAALVPGEWTITGDERMRERPIGPLVSALRELGVEAEDASGCPPVRVRGGTWRHDACRLDASLSSQFLSALLLAGSAREGGIQVDLTTALASPGYLRATESALRHFGHGLEREGERLRLVSVPSRGRRLLRVDADWSAAGFWLVLSSLTGGDFHDPALWKGGSDQPDFDLPKMLAFMRKPGDLDLDLSALPDQAMNLAVVAARRRGRTRFRGLANLRHKECDRLTVMTREFQRAGITIKEEPDGVIIEGPATLRPCTFNPEGDHRMVMALALLGSLADGLSVSDADCVSKSYPGFIRDLERAHERARAIAIIGMRGAGKSSLAVSLARVLGLRSLDTDAIVEARLGQSIADVVRHRGWSAFRDAESQAVATALEPNCVVALGGGAIETEDVRCRLQDRAVVVWVREAVPTLVTRLRANEDRPRLSDAALEDEVASFAARRDPIHAMIADIVLPSGVDLETRTSQCWQALQDLCSW